MASAWGRSFGFAWGNAWGQMPQPPENGPSGGANWLRGYKPTHDYSSKRRRGKRDELLICRA
jgi:hypothetical protein